MDRPPRILRCSNSHGASFFRGVSLSAGCQSEVELLSFLEIPSRSFSDALTNRIKRLPCRNVRCGSSAEACDDADVEPTMSFAVTGRNAEGKNTRHVSHPRKETKISAQDSERKAGSIRRPARTIHFTSTIASFLVPRSTTEVSIDLQMVYAQ